MTVPTWLRSATVRAVRTFVQTALGVYLAAVTGPSVGFDDLSNLDVIEAAVAAGVVAALSFVQNALEGSRQVAYDRG